ncbi:hypothetical protein 3 [Hubei tombus-like virus 18]|uniref:hypothetical protein 3 n=1 Tax=Hubei tombus-like virus 18 TaxID=1923264 RepID=UPI00090AEAF5|nr:hypothetical protein 3 [Hubei tombus-like virus 18]APG76335.1 hypothetical protein 3 [Hubei tombus-like virus 18]
MFIKPDRYKVEECLNKAPRAIQFRSRMFNLKMATYLKPVEQHFCKYFKPYGTRVCAKGLNLRERGRLIMEKIRKFHNPCYINIDHSKFDSTVNLDHLKNLHKLYRRVCGKTIQKYLKYQYKNRCYSKNGIKYQTEATRCSGDFDTGLGNTIINAACLMYVFRNIKVEFILDGDDAVVILEKADLNNVKFDDFEKFGFETTMEIVYDKYKIEFCQSRLVYNRGWMLSRNPFRAISHQSHTRSRIGPKGLVRYLSGVGKCELACSAGIPLLDKFANMLMLSSDRPLLDVESLGKMSILGWAEESLDVRWNTRISFWKAWGVPPDVQEWLETLLLPPYAYSGVTESKKVQGLHQVIKAKNSSFHYASESLLGAWQRMAGLGCAGTAGWWLSGE